MRFLGERRPAPLKPQDPNSRVHGLIYAPTCKANSCCHGAPLGAQLQRKCPADITLGRILSILCLVFPASSFSQDSVFEQPGIEVGLFGGWQSFNPAPINGITLQSPLLGGEFVYRFRNGLGVGLTVSYSQACFENPGDVSPCVTQIPVVWEVSWAKFLGGGRPWLGVGAGLGFIGWTNSAFDLEDQGYNGNGLDVVYLRVRLGFDFTVQTGTSGLAMGPFFSASFGTSPQPVPTGLGAYSAHQTYVVGFRVLVLPGPH
jgi:hypothetical protein